MQWVILGRIPRPLAVVQPAEVVEVGAQAAGAELEAGAGLAADFSFPLVPTPQVTVMNAAPTAHPDPNNPGQYPYILGVHSACLLLNVGAPPFPGVCFGDLPGEYQSNLVVVRDFELAGVEPGHPPTVTARAQRIVPRDWWVHDSVSNIESIGLLSTPDGVHAYLIAELMIFLGSNLATLVYIDADDDAWHQVEVPSPLPTKGREWVPSGVVSHLGMLWWFDLSWGLISYDHYAEAPLLRFHDLPEDRDLDMAQPGLHDSRCITESQGELLYVEIIHNPDGTEGHWVCMWIRVSAADNNHATGGWHEEHALSFQEIWNDDSYIDTGLPRKVPVLVAVSPYKWDIVYFVLEEEERLFSVDLLTCTVFEYRDEDYDLVTPWPVPPSCRYVLPWSLPPQIAQAPGIANSDDWHHLEVEIVEAIDQKELQEAENQEEEDLLEDLQEDFEEELMMIANDEELQEAEIDDGEQPQAEIDDEQSQAEVDDDGEQPQAEIDVGEQPQAEIHKDDLSSEGTLKLDVKMDPETLSRLKAEVKEYFSNKEDHPGPSQDPEDDAGVDAI